MNKNVVKFYVLKEEMGPKERFDEIISKLGVDTEDYSEDDKEYVSFTVKRDNHFSMSNGTAMKISLNDTDATVKEYVNWINDLVDNIV